MIYGIILPFCTHEYILYTAHQPLEDWMFEVQGKKQKWKELQLYVVRDQHADSCFHQTGNLEGTFISSMGI